MKHLLYEKIISLPQLKCPVTDNVRAYSQNKF
jgi:hypothetical protein